MKLHMMAAVSFVLFAGSAAADEQMVPLAQSGDWAAIAHRPSMTAVPDVCVAINVRSRVAFWSDGGTVEIRISDSKWSLPTHVDGSIEIVIGDWKTIQTISGNEASMVTAVLDEDTYPAMFAAMDKASSMAVTVGKAKPINVSLAGSSRVTNAFRTCAGITGGDLKGGENPFK